MPPRRKSRRLNGSNDAPAVQFVPDPVASTSSAVSDPPSTSSTSASAATSDALVTAIVTAVKEAISPQQSANQQPSTSRPQAEHVPISSQVDLAVQDEVEAISGVIGGNSSESPVFHSIAVPLGSRVSSKVKAKIWAEEFIDMGSLLAPTPNPDKYSLSITAPSSGASFKAPNFTFEPVQSTKKLSSINDWLSAFHTWAAIYLVKFTTEAPNVLKYCETVRDIAARAGDWYFYDEQFRYLRQSAPVQYPWAIVHWELWHRAVTFRAKQANSQYEKTNPRSRSKAVFAKGFCWAYNSGRYCGGCRFDHKCSKCGGKHQSVQCQSSQVNTQSAEQRASTASFNSRQPTSNARKSVPTQ